MLTLAAHVMLLRYPQPSLPVCCGLLPLRFGDIQLAHHDNHSNACTLQGKGTVSYFCTPVLCADRVGKRSDVHTPLNEKLYVTQNKLKITPSSKTAGDARYKTSSQTFPSRVKIASGLQKLWLSWDPVHATVGLAHLGDLASGQVIHTAHNLELALLHQAGQHGGHLQTRKARKGTISKPLALYRLVSCADWCCGTCKLCLLLLPNLFYAGT